MKLVDKLEETLNGGYPGLYGEVVTCDMYHLRTVPFTPDLVIDIGANVGIFSRYARSLWPAATIIALEPDPMNAAYFQKFTKDRNITLLRWALGRGPVYYRTGAVNGGGEVYLTHMVGFPLEKLQAGLSQAEFQQEDIPSISFSDLTRLHWCAKKKSVIKIDCEGAENSIWDSPEAVADLAKYDYIAIEVHDYGIDGAERDRVLAAKAAAISALEKTHTVTTEHVYLWALKKTVCK